MRVRGSASPLILVIVLFVLGVVIKASYWKQFTSTELTGMFGRIIIGGDSRLSVRLRGVYK